MEWLSDPKIWIGLVTLTILEIVLGIDNIIFISILAGKLPERDRHRARQTGLALAVITRILLLLSAGWVMTLTRPIVGFGEVKLAGKDLILIGGGLFLIAKAVREIHEKLEGVEGEISARIAPSFAAVVGQILVLDIVFSLDSVITAVGMVRQLPVMVAAVIIAVIFMLVFAGSIGAFVDRHPTVKMLALAFLVLIGANLITEGFHHEIPKGYTYFAMAFAAAVEALNVRLRSKAEPVHLRSPID